MTRPLVLQVCAVDFTARHFLLPLMEAQREWGFDVEAVCRPGEHAAFVESRGFRIHPERIERNLNAAAHFAAHRRLRRLFAELRPAAVHLHTPVAALIGRPAARWAGVPAVFYTAHGFYFHDLMRPWVRSAHVALERWAQRRADFLFTQSAEDLETALREGIAPAGRALAIGNGVDVSRFRPGLLDASERTAALAEFGFAPGDGPVVLMLGRLVREKGHMEFLDAWARAVRRHPRAGAIVVGDSLPSDRDRASGLIRDRAKELGLDGSLVFAGFREDVPRLMGAADLFVLPSWREGMPRSILEAMASGLPVVASDIRGCREEVIEGETGFLVPPRDPEALAGAIETLLDDGDLRARMGRAGRLRAEREFSEEAVIARQEAVYRKVFAEKGLAWPERRSGR